LFICFEIVAKKNKATGANIKMLAGRIINGSTGIWGTSQMTPHPDLTEVDAEKTVHYILSLKEQ
jgi:cytochrome c